MNEKIFSLLNKTVSAERIQKNTEELHRLEGNESYDNLIASTDFALRMMKESGFEKVERIPLPADGKTAYFDCIMPMAWKTTGRSFLRLEDGSIPEEERMIADSDKDPFNAGIWGAPTPEEGITCPVVDCPPAGGKPEEVAGKLVLLDARTLGCYKVVVKNGCAGVIISDSKGGEEFPDFCRWSNGLSYTGWYHTAEDRRVPVFSITPRRAAFLRERLARGPLKAYAVARTSICEGEIYTLTGVIPGASDEEITMVAHMYEPFLPDDSAGAAVICELARSLKELAAKGELPGLKKTLRIVLSMERYGFSQYYLDTERNKRTLTVYSFDSCCHLAGGKDEPRLKLRLSTIVQPSYMSLLMPELYRKFVPETTFILERGNLSDDTFCADDFIGIPTLWTHSGNHRYHHNSGPMFMAADWELAKKVACIMGTAVGGMATGDGKYFRSAAEEVIELGKKEIAERAAEARYQLKMHRLDKREATEKIRFLANKAAAELESVNRFAPGTVTQADKDLLIAAGEKELAGIPPVQGEPELHDFMAKAAKLVPRRLVPGTLMSMVRVPHAERRKPRMEDLLYILLDGKRTLYEAMKLYEYEMDTHFDDDAYGARIEALRFLEKYGYVALEER